VSITESLDAARDPELDEGQRRNAHCSFYLHKTPPSAGFFYLFFFFLAQRVCAERFSESACLIFVPPVSEWRLICEPPQASGHGPST